jgi:hypothetical protein
MYSGGSLPSDASSPHHTGDGHIDDYEIDLLEQRVQKMELGATGFIPGSASSNGAQFYVDLLRLKNGNVTRNNVASEAPQAEPEFVSDPCPLGRACGSCSSFIVGARDQGKYFSLANEHSVHVSGCRPLPGSHRGIYD